LKNMGHPLTKISESKKILNKMKTREIDIPLYMKTLFVACNNGFQDVIRTMLYKFQGDLPTMTKLINCRNEYNDTPLIVASDDGHDHVVRTLLETTFTFKLELDINAKNDFGLTAISAACYHSSTKYHNIIRLLLRNGADPYIECAAYINAFQNARRQKNYDALSILLANYPQNNQIIQLYQNN